MSFSDELQKHAAEIDQLSSVARARSCESFADLCWDRVDPFALEPGILIETATRVVVIQRINGELRYYAGGWGTQESISREYNEFGLFQDLDHALRFTKLFLGDRLALSKITTRRVRRGGTHLARI